MGGVFSLLDDDVKLKQQYEGIASYNNGSEDIGYLRLKAEGEPEIVEKSVLQALADYPLLDKLSLVDINISDKIANALLKLSELNSLELSSSFYSYERVQFDSLEFSA